MDFKLFVLSMGTLMLDLGLQSGQVYVMKDIMEVTVMLDLSLLLFFVIREKHFLL